jgi:hypothetical protein
VSVDLCALLLLLLWLLKGIASHITIASSADQIGRFCVNPRAAGKTGEARRCSNP